MYMQTNNIIKVGIWIILSLNWTLYFQIKSTGLNWYFVDLKQSWIGTGIPILDKVSNWSFYWFERIMNWNR